MPVNATLLRELIDKHGEKEGRRIYYAMEHQGSPAFRKGLKTALREGHVLGLALKPLKGMKAAKSKFHKHRKPNAANSGSMAAGQSKGNS